MSGLYRGVTPNTVGAGSAWGFYFLFYQTIKVSEYCVLFCTQYTPIFIIYILLVEFLNIYLFQKQIAQFRKIKMIYVVVFQAFKKSLNVYSRLRNKKGTAEPS